MSETNANANNVGNDRNFQQNADFIKDITEGINPISTTQNIEIFQQTPFSVEELLVGFSSN
ncbi:44048_t:CDS:2 [Gigaspora margarita]|uniref:44048_t:CDS:1 n=1 Tax=Gigaspora margarita TaxID=4874 RepID=A0ABN7UY04_GIGMA|nr:44048_t:CDS:2 [Gigaspora margarita]